MDENIKFGFENDNYLIDNCSFEYNYIIIEPDIDIYDNYTENIVFYYEKDTENEFNSMKTPLIGRTSYFNINLKYNLSKNCEDFNCDLCRKSSPDICINCKNNSYFNIIDGIKIKKCNQTLLKPETTIIEGNNIDTTTNEDYETQIPTLETSQIIIESTFNEEDKKVDTTKVITEKTIKIDTTEAITEIIKENIKIDDNCSIEEIINNLCQNEKINGNQSEEIYKKLKQDCLNKECASQNKIVTTNNIVYQISTLETQQNSVDSDISSIDLGKCEEKLKKKYNLADEDDLIIFKKDIKDSLTTYVEYEIYNPYNLELLNLYICNYTQISIIFL